VHLVFQVFPVALVLQDLRDYQAQSVQLAHQDQVAKPVQRAYLVHRVHLALVQLAFQAFLELSVHLVCLVCKVFLVCPVLRLRQEQLAFPVFRVHLAKWVLLEQAVCRVFQELLAHLVQADRMVPLVCLAHLVFQARPVHLAHLVFRARSAHLVFRVFLAALVLQVCLEA
jgi:hypothetical protein